MLLLALSLCMLLALTSHFLFLQNRNDNDTSSEGEGDKGWGNQVGYLEQASITGLFPGPMPSHSPVWIYFRDCEWVFHCIPRPPTEGPALNSSALWTKDREYCLFVFLWLVFYLGSVWFPGNSPLCCEKICVFAIWGACNLFLRSPYYPLVSLQSMSQWRILLMEHISGQSPQSAPTQILCFGVANGQSSFSDMV